MDQLLLGFPHTVPSYTVDRFCSSGLKAIAEVPTQNKQVKSTSELAEKSKAWEIIIWMVQLTKKNSQKIFDHEKERNCMIPMDFTSENVAEAHKIDKKTKTNSLSDRTKIRLIQDRNCSCKGQGWG